MNLDYDSPWKEALDIFFEAFLALLFPEVHREIDWSRAYESLDKEFQQVVRDAEVGRRYVDKLVKVWTKDGAERWVLIHVEVQTTREGEFAERMYVYNHRIFDRYNRPVASLAVLADEDANWRPSEFRNSLFGCETGIRFPVVKLLDFEQQEAALEANTNPFAKIVLAHLKAQRTQDDPADRKAWKLRLVRGLYEQGFSSEDVRELFRLIDWLMVLPDPLAALFSEDVTKIEEENRMPFITTPERVGLRRGLREAIQLWLESRFGIEGLKLMPGIENIHSEDQLRIILKALGSAMNLEEVRQLTTSGNP